MCSCLIRLQFEVPAAACSHKWQSAVCWHPHTVRAEYLSDGAPICRVPGPGRLGIHCCHPQAASHMPDNVCRLASILDHSFADHPGYVQLLLSPRSSAIVILLAPTRWQLGFWSDTAADCDLSTLVLGSKLQSISEGRYALLATLPSCRFLLDSTRPKNWVWPQVLLLSKPCSARCRAWPPERHAALPTGRKRSALTLKPVHRHPRVLTAACPGCEMQSTPDLWAL